MSQQGGMLLIMQATNLGGSCRADILKGGVSSVRLYFQYASIVPQRASTPPSTFFLINTTCYEQKNFLKAVVSSVSSTISRQLAERIRTVCVSANTTVRIRTQQIPKGLSTGSAARANADHAQLCEKAQKKEDRGGVIRQLISLMPPPGSSFAYSRMDICQLFSSAARARACPPRAAIAPLAA